MTVATRFHVGWTNHHRPSSSVSINLSNHSSHCRSGIASRGFGARPVRIQRWIVVGETPGSIARTRGFALQQVDNPLGESLLAQHDG